jgi:hypothetical protein
LEIDVQCKSEGTSWLSSAQNLVKNNFCAKGSATDITIAEMERLQLRAQEDRGIRFGSRIPMMNRVALQILGEGSLVRLKAYVMKARPQQSETVNCEDKVPDDPAFHDIHVVLVNSPAGADERLNDSTDKECTAVIAEIIPHHRPDSWTGENLERVAQSRTLVRITGQLFFDTSHKPCSNGMPGRNDPKRISLWEIHPIYEFEVCSGKCTNDGEWLSLDQWVTLNERVGISQSPINKPSVDVPPETHTAQGVEPRNFVTSATRAGSDPNVIDASIRGNKRSKIYHWAGCPDYDKIAVHNRVAFPSRAEAEKAGYRAAGNCR